MLKVDFPKNLLVRRSRKYRQDVQISSFLYIANVSLNQISTNNLEWKENERKVYLNPKPLDTTLLVAIHQWPHRQSPLQLVILLVYKATTGDNGFPVALSVEGVKSGSDPKSGDRWFRFLRMVSCHTQWWLSCYRFWGRGSCLFGIFYMPYGLKWILDRSLHFIGKLRRSYTRILLYRLSGILISCV